MKKGGQRGRGRVWKPAWSPHYWIAYQSSPKHEVRESSGSTKYGVANNLLKQRIKERDDGKLVVGAAKKVTVGELLADLQTDYTMRGLASATILPGQIEALKGAIRKKGGGRAGKVIGYSKHGLGDVEAASLTTAMWNKLVVEWQAVGAANQTINMRRGALLAALQLAVKSKPPKLSPHGIPDLPKLKVRNTRQVFFTRSDLLALLEHIHEPAVRDLCEWAYWTGMRKGEASALRWAMVEEETGTLKVPGDTTKNEEPRRIPIAGPLRDIIERRRAVRRTDTQLIFWKLYRGCATKRLLPGRPTAVKRFDTAWKTACRKAGIAGHHFHDFRRAACTNLIRSGLDRRTAMRISGHKSESMFTRYCIGTDADVEQGLERVAAYVAGLPTERKVVPLPRQSA